MWLQAVNLIFRRQGDYQKNQPILVASASAINSNMNVPQRIPRKFIKLVKM